MIYIVRHGQTEMNRQHILQGRINPPLNDTGRDQAREAAEKLKMVSFSTVYCSPLIRAIETARIIVPSIEPTVDERLIEMDCGPYDGIGIEQLPKEILDFLKDLAHHPAPDGIEALNSVTRRVGAFWEECCRTTDNLLIATHGGALSGILEYLNPTDNGSNWSRPIRNCAIFVVEYQTDGRWSLPIEV